MHPHQRSNQLVPFLSQTPESGIDEDPFGFHTVWELESFGKLLTHPLKNYYKQSRKAYYQHHKSRCVSVKRYAKCLMEVNHVILNILINHSNLPVLCGTQMKTSAIFTLSSENNIHSWQSSQAEGITSVKRIKH